MKYKLYMFKNSIGRPVITRGETMEQAKQYLIDICKEKSVEFVPFNLCHAPYVYSTNHPFDWTQQAPLWLNDGRKLAPANPLFRDRFLKTAKLSAGQNRV